MALSLLVMLYVSSRQCKICMSPYRVIADSIGCSLHSSGYHLTRGRRQEDAKRTTSRSIDLLRKAQPPSTKVAYKKTNNKTQIQTHTKHKKFHSNLTFFFVVYRIVIPLFISVMYVAFHLLTVNLRFCACVCGECVCVCVCL
jgi:hypothetical protein